MGPGPCLPGAEVDDQYAIGIHRPAPTHNDLVDALDAVLSGQPVAVARPKRSDARWPGLEACQ